MKIAHLILAHKNPKQLERLIRALQHPDFDIYIHIDKKADITPFQHLFNDRNVFAVRNRTKIYWASFGTIQATLNGFNEILPKGLYDYINVISAQDFPIKPASSIYQFFLDKKGTEFITCEGAENGWPEIAPRMQKYSLVNFQVKGRYAVEALLNKYLPPRKFPFDMKPVGRANWFTLSLNAVQYVMDFIAQHPEYKRFFQFTWGADEVLFSTILYNSPFKDRIEKNVVYVDWPENNDGHPKLLGSEDFEKLKASDKLFARKFDMEKDAVIFDLLESYIGISEKPEPAAVGR